MATTTAERELYPLSTTDNKPIPFDIMLPLGSITWDFAANARTLITIPGSFDLVYAFASSDVLISFASALDYPVAVNTEMPDAFILPGDSLITMRLPKSGAASIIPLRPAASGVVYMQNMQKWAALGLKRQLGTR